MQTSKIVCRVYLWFQPQKSFSNQSRASPLRKRTPVSSAAAHSCGSQRMTAHRHATKQATRNSRQTRRQRYARRVAIHEAGHAVIDTVLFGGITEARLWNEGGRTHGCSSPLPHDTASCQMMSVFAYAGPVAEAKYRRC